SAVIVSDMDGTLTTAETWRGVLAWTVLYRPSAAARRFVNIRLPLVLLAKLGVISKERFRARWLSDQATLLRGANADELAAMGEWVVEHHLWPARRIAGLNAVAAALDDARLTHPTAELLLATGGYQQVGDAFARRIGAVAALGTPLELFEGRATGRLAAATQSGEQKAAAVRARAAGAPLLAAFGDTAADIPLLSMAQRAVAVAPDTYLRREALRRGWEIVG
ncbi:MAG: haloacid dehalogenase-like hydrolase, partial [Chloroflexota bacterium]